MCIIAQREIPRTLPDREKNVRFFDNVIALVDTTDYTKSDTKRIKVHIRKSRNFPICRENQPELELQDIGSGAYWAQVGEAAFPQEFKRDMELNLDWRDQQQDIPF